MEIVVWLVVLVLVIVPFIVAIFNAELAWTIGLAVAGILIVCLGGAIILNRGPPLAADPIGAIRTMLHLTAQLAASLALLGGVTYGIWFTRARRRSRPETRNASVDKSPST